MKGRVISPLVQSREGGLLLLLLRGPGGAWFQLSFGGDVGGQILPWRHSKGGVSEGVLSSTRLINGDAKGLQQQQPGGSDGGSGDAMVVDRLARRDSSKGAKCLFANCGQSEDTWILAVLGRLYM